MPASAGARILLPTRKRENDENPDSGRTGNWRDERPGEPRDEGLTEVPADFRGGRAGRPNPRVGSAYNKDREGKRKRSKSLVVIIMHDDGGSRDCCDGGEGKGMGVPWMP